LSLIELSSVLKIRPFLAGLIVINLISSHADACSAQSVEAIAKSNSTALVATAQSTTATPLATAKTPLATAQS
jgi:hypothetical protein